MAKGKAPVRALVVVSDDEADAAEEEAEEEEEVEEEEEAAAEEVAVKRKPAAKGKGKKGGTAAGVGDKAHATAAEFAKYDPLKAAEGMWKVRRGHFHCARPGACACADASRPCAQSGEPVPFLFLARTFEACSETTKRLEIDMLLTNALRSVIATTPVDLLPSVYLSSCSVAPAHESVELGIGDATLIKALAEATGRSEAAVKEAYTQHGDLGVVAQQCRATQRTMFAMPVLTVRGVFNALRDIAKTEGNKSSERKRATIKKLLVSAREVEAGYIIRLLQGKLRVGLAQQTVVAAVAHAALLQEDAAAAATDATAALRGTPLADRLGAADAVLKQVYSECPTWDLIIPAMLKGGVIALPETCHFVPGVPVKPMLAKPTHGARARVCAHEFLTAAALTRARSCCRHLGDHRALWRRRVLLRIQIRRRARAGERSTGACACAHVLLTCCLCAAAADPRARER